MRALQDDSSPQWLTRVYDGLAFSERGPSPDTRNTFPALQKDCGLIPFRGMIVSGLDKRPWKRIDSLSRLPCAWLGRVEDGADITFDYGDFARSAVAYFARRNRRHVAYLRTFGYLPWARHDIPAFKATASECGTERTEIHDLDALHRDACDEHATYESVQSILRGWSQTRWPDAILVSDDVVMRAVALALLNAEHPGARQVELVTWANDKVRFHYGIPTARYDVPVDYCAQRLKDILSQRMDGKTPENIPERIRGRIVESA
jgi:DNA-binding LacI/PurR family transcriptional regulator